MQKINLLATGLNGLVGSRFKKDFSHKYEMENLDLRSEKNPVDITKYDQVLKSFQNSQAEFVIHLAAFTDVTAAYLQRNDKNGICYLVNVLGTENIVKACKETNKHLIHISTSYVFDGKKKESYLETDKTGTPDWYGHTKLQAEKVVQNSAINWTILRIEQPFRSDSFEKLDVLHKTIQGFKDNSLYPQFTDHYFGPTYINDLSKVFDWVIKTKTTGLFHASSGEVWSDYEFAKAIKDILKLNGDLKKGSLLQYLKTTDRPYLVNTSLNSDKLKKLLDFKFLSIKEAISQTELD